jgi:hypothetical protein
MVLGRGTAQKTLPLTSNGYMRTTYKTPLATLVSLLHSQRRRTATEAIRLLPAYSLQWERVYRVVA